MNELKNNQRESVSFCVYIFLIVLNGYTVSTYIRTVARLYTYWCLASLLLSADNGVELGHRSSSQAGWVTAPKTRKVIHAQVAN